MQDFIIILILVAILPVAICGAKKRLKGGCCGAGETKIKPKDKNKAHYPFKVKVYVNGMTCLNCNQRVENAFNARGSFVAKANLGSGCVTVWSKSEIKAEEMSDIVEKSGYTYVKCEIIG